MLVIWGTIINTCAFIDSSRAESYGVIDEMVSLKAAGGTRGVIVAGCLAERQKDAASWRSSPRAVDGVRGRRMKRHDD